MGEQSAFESKEQSFLLEAFLAYRSLMMAAASTGREAASGLFVLLADPITFKPSGPQPMVRALAARIAGAAALLVCAEEAAAKAAVRSGASDFLVAGETGLDEALRILKNELRRGSGVGVCLHASPADTVEGCVKRGVQPDLVDFAEPRLLARGSVLIAWSTQLAKGQKIAQWNVPTGSLSVMIALDATATMVVAANDPLRQRWLQAAPPMLGRAWQRSRLLSMTTDETEIFAREAQSLATANCLAMYVVEDERSLRVELR